MNEGVNWLRLLEPAVRPAGLPDPARSPQSPIESRSFESLLEEAQASSSETPAPDGEAKDAGANLLAPLSAVDRIDNQALRDLIARGRDQA